MLSFVLWMLLQSAAPPEDPLVEEATPEVAPYAGQLSDGLDELAEASEDDDHARALELAGGLLASPWLGHLAEPRRARLLHDVGLARARASLVDQAVADLRSAAGLAGPGELRATALYTAGTARLLYAEQVRLMVPEIAQQLGLPVPPQPPVPPAGEQQPDPLDLARAAYLTARAELLERLALDWRDEDTRANLELVSRRLRELDEIERQREEQQQQQEQQQQEQSQQDQQQDDSQQPDEPSEDEQPPEQSPEEQPPEGDQEQEQPPEPEPGEEQPSEQAEQQPAREEERVLSREEVQRLLDQLAQIEEQARAVRAMLRESRRTPVEKDW